MAQPVRVTFLGGLGDIGRNCAVVEVAGKLIVLDCGQMFGDERTPGVGTILPDFGFLRDRADDIVGLIATHSHEDHVGGIPYLLSEIPMPVYGSPYTLGIVRHKLQEVGIAGKADLRVINDGETHRIGPIDCEFIPVTHSTPSGLITAFHTPQGVILHSCDFKLDLTPVDGRLTDLSRIGALASGPGIRLLLCDSTNAESPGYTQSESHVGGVLRRVFEQRPGQRIIVGAFSSHIHRLQQVADAAIANGRMFAVLGRSMQRNVTLARELGLLRIPDPKICQVEDVDDMDPGTVCIVCTGSQGEPRSALAQMAAGDSRFVQIGERDTVVFSSHPIPGNEAAVARMRNSLARMGAEVVHSGLLEVHTSGHGKAHELRTLHSVASPEFFVPVHGEFFHLKAHAAIAAGMGMTDDRVVVCEDGDSVVLTDRGIERGSRTSGAYIYVDGMVGDLGATVLGDRFALGENGFVSITVVVDRAANRLASDPVVTSKGWLEPPVDEPYHKALAAAVLVSIEELLGGESADRSGRAPGGSGPVPTGEIERVARRTVGKLVADRTKRRPMIVPTVIEL